jgi:hypothetical protein
MRTWLLVAALGLVMACVGGCIIIDTEKTGVCVTRSAEPADVTNSEIDAVSKLSVEDNRREGYRRIAERKCLAADAQTHLVEAVFQHLSLEDSKVDVVMALIHNRCFNSEAKAAILQRLDSLSLEDNRREVLDAISSRKG